jgi:hypothetical protein
MNERLKQLAIESKLIAPEYNGFDHTRLSISQQRFAELIVRECVELVSVNRDLAIEDGWNVDEAMFTAINDIEEHFGVES